MRFQGFNSAEIARQLCLGKSCMYLAVANVVKQDCRASFPALKLWNQVVQTLLDVFGDRSIA